MDHYDSLDRAQLNAIRYFLGVHKYAANDFLIGEAGWISGRARHQLAVLRLSEPFINLPSFRTTTRGSSWDLSQCDKASRNIFMNLKVLNIATRRYVTKTWNLIRLRNGMLDEPANPSWDIIICINLIKRSKMIYSKCTGPWFNINVTSYQYRKSHCEDKTVVRSSYLHNGIFYTGKMSSVYWIGAQVSDRSISCWNSTSQYRSW